MPPSEARQLVTKINDLEARLEALEKEGKAGNPHHPKNHPILYTPVHTRIFAASSYSHWEPRPPPPVTRTKTATSRPTTASAASTTTSTTTTTSEVFIPLRMVRRLNLNMFPLCLFHSIGSDYPEIPANILPARLSPSGEFMLLGQLLQGFRYSWTVQDFNWRLGCHILLFHRIRGCGRAMSIPGGRTVGRLWNKGGVWSPKIFSDAAHRLQHT